MNKKRKMKYIGLIMLLAGVLMIAPNITNAKENTDAGGGGGGDGGYKVVCEITGCATTDSELGISGVMFSVVDKNGKRLDGTTSYIISNRNVSYSRILKANGNRYFNKMEVINDLGYVQSSGNWQLYGQNVHVEGWLQNFVHNSDFNDNASNGGYILDQLLKIYSGDEKYWKHYAKLCGYNYDNYSYNEIQNHYLIFEPMSTFQVGGSHRFSGHYFATFQQSASLIKYLSGSRNYRQSVSAINGDIPILNRFSPSIYMPTGTAGFGPGSGGTNNWNDVNKKIGNGIGSINIAEECGDECAPKCDISINEHFPIDSATGKVQWVEIDTKDPHSVKIVAENTKNAYNCCSYFAGGEADKNGKTYSKEELYQLRPECAYPVICPPDETPDLNCTSNTSGQFKSPGKADSDSWYCMKSKDIYSPYVKKIINQYARVVCREDLTVSFPPQLKNTQSVGTYMVWPTSTLNGNSNNYPLNFNGSLTCQLSIDKAEIEATGNATAIYNDIYNNFYSYTNSNNCKNENNCEAKEWYKLNNTIILNVSYNDDEYGGKKINLSTDVNNSNAYLNKTYSGDISYDQLKGLEIQVVNNKTYKLRDDIYNLLTPPGLKNGNMYGTVNKNEWVQKKFKYGILPISYTAKVSRNISNTNSNYYKLTLSYSNIGDNGKFVKNEKTYTCPYEVTFAPPTNKDDKVTDDKEHDDNNDSYDQATECPCPKNSSYPYMDLRGYLIKNRLPNGEPKMTCAEAQELYCNADRGNMNVEYRVISLKEPFPGINGNGREIGYNWRDNMETPRAGETVDKYILNNRGVSDYEVYNKTGELGPLYRIELNSKTIQAIRQYNKSTTYADFTLTCYDKDNGKKCVSNFLRGRMDEKFNINLINSGKCQNVSKSDFYACADKDEPTEK